MSLLCKGFAAIKRFHGTILSNLLIWSVKYNWYRACRICIKLGADINKRRHNGETLLHMAINAQNPTIVHILIEAGADVHARDQQNRTPLELVIFNWANSNNNALGIATKLINAGANPKDLVFQDTNSTAIPIFFYAILRGVKSVIQLFLEKDHTLADLEVNGITAWHFAINTSNNEIIELISIKQKTNDMLEIAALAGDPGDYSNYLNVGSQDYCLQFNERHWSDSEAEENSPPKGQKIPICSQLPN